MHGIQTIGTAFLIAIAVFLVFLPAVRHDFINLDDDSYVTENPHVATGLTCESVAWAFTSSHSANWHPITWLSHMLDVALFGLKPAGHHLTSVVLHAINAALVFVFLRAATGAFWSSVFTALFFGLHPLRVESVAWVAERKDVLCALFGLATLIAYVAYARRPGLRGYGVVAALFALGLLAKPMLVTWPCLLLLIDYWPLRRIEEASRARAAFGRSIRIVLEKLPLLAIAAAAATITYFAQRSAGAVVDAQSIPLPTRAGNAALSYARYLGKTFLPHPLAVPYPFDGDVITPLNVGAALLLIAAITAFALWAARRHPAIGIGWLWYLGLLVPVIGFVQVGSQAMADRYMYLPSIGLFMAIVWGMAAVAEGWTRETFGRGGGAVGRPATTEVGRPDTTQVGRPPIARERRLVAALGILALVACVIVTRTQLRHWRDSETLFRYALAVTRDNSVAHNNLGKQLMQRHLSPVLETQPDVSLDASVLDEAATHFAEAVRISPGNLDARNNLATVWLLQGRHEDAAREFARLLRVRHDDPALYVNYGATVMGLGENAAAIEAAQRALELDPGFEKATQLLNMARPAESESSPPDAPSSPAP